jgi:MFS family permease
MSLLMAFSIVVIILAVGDIISTKTKAFIPSVFVAALLFLFGFWTFFPKDIVALAGFQTPVVYLSMYLLITHMGTLLSVSELAAQWRSVAVALIGIAGVMAMTMTLGAAVFGFDAAVIATPPLTGGVVAAIIMNEAAADLGLQQLAVLAIITYVMQGFVGYPLTSWMLKKEGQRLIKGFRNGEIEYNESEAESAEAESKKLIPDLPKKYKTTYVLLAKLGLTAWAAVAVGNFLDPYLGISPFVYCLIFGVIANAIGFVEKRPLNLSNSFGFLITVLMAFIFAGLSDATPAMLAELAVPLAGIIFFGVTGMAVLSMLLGKFLGYTKEMSFATALTALYGFPPNYILTEEGAKALAKNEEEKKFLMSEMLPKMLVGGFTTVTIASVIIAGIFVNFL